MPATDVTRDSLIGALRLVNPSPAFDRACAQMDAMAAAWERIGEVERSKARRRRRERIRFFSAPANYGALLRWLSSAPLASVQFETVDQAVLTFRRRLARHRSVKARGGWYPELAMAAPAYRDRLTVALYFARHGAAIWAREAA